MKTKKEKNWNWGSIAIVNIYNAPCNWGSFVTKIGIVRAAVRVALSLLKYISLKDGVLDVFVYTVNHAILFWING